MLDAFVRPLIDKPLNLMGKHLARAGVKANHITLVGFAAGLLVMLAIAFGSLNFAIFLITLNRLADGLDGAVARHTQLSDFGGFLDIVCDFIVYAGVVYAFVFVAPENASYAAFLIFCYIGTITSFLAYAIIAAKRNVSTVKRGKKSFYYLGGICEGTETAALMFLMCLFPGFFAQLCIGYGIMCILTTMGRVYAAFNAFEDVYTEQEAAQAPQAQ